MQPKAAGEGSRSFLPAPLPDRGHLISSALPPGGICITISPGPQVFSGRLDYPTGFPRSPRVEGRLGHFSAFIIK